MTNGVRHAVAVVGSPIRGHVWWPTKSDWINTIVREVYYNQPGRKVRASDMVDRMGRTVRGRAADTAALEPTVVLVEGTGMLEMEDEVEQGQRGRGGPRLYHHGRKILPLLLSWHILVDVRFGGGGCRDDFRP